MLGFSPLDPSEARYEFAQAVMPLSWWLVLFGAAGVVAIVAGFLFPPARKAVGFAALQFAATAWGTVILISALFNDTQPRGPRSAALWLVTAVSIHIVSGLEEPE